MRGTDHLLLRLRVRQGRARVRAALGPVLLAAGAGIVAYLIGEHVLGHEYPFFAPIGVWMCLGFTSDRQVRRVAELAVGVALGTGFGSLAVHHLGTGPWQIAIVVVIAVLLSRFIDAGVLLATQAGTQAIVIVGMPTLGGGPMGRWTDAMVGGVVALLAAALVPGDLRKRPRALGREAATEMAEMLGRLAGALGEGSPEGVEDALVRGRGAQPTLERWQTAATAAQESARVSAGARGHRAELVELGRQAVLMDRAMRSVRVLARRAIPVCEHEHDVGPVVEVIGQTALGVQELAVAIGRGTSAHEARDVLTSAARLAAPGVLGLDDWQVQSLMMLMRSPIVDLLEAAGCTPAEAREVLPEL